jgi:hypothetical protein
VRRWRLAAAALFIALAAAGIAVRAWPSRPLVWLDNGGDEEVVITLDGETVTSVPARGFTAVTLPSGAHRLEARTPSAPGKERLQRYAVYTMTYGKDHPGDEPRPVATSERLFVMPPDVAPDFMRPLPSALTVAHGTREATARGLYHFPLHADRSCCHTQ